MKAENIAKATALFYWFHSLILVVLSFINLFRIRLDQSTLINGLFIFYGLGFLLYATSFADLGLKLWKVNEGAINQAVIYSSITLFFLFLVFLMYSFELWHPTFFLFLSLVLLHILIIWRLSRQEIRGVFKSTIKNNNSEK
jgi:hypothetical protein